MDSQAMRWNWASHCEFHGKSMETETTKWSEFPNGVKVNVEQILMWKEERNPQSGMQVGKLTTGVRSYLRQKNYNRVHQIYQFHQNRLVSPYDGC